MTKDSSLKKKKPKKPKKVRKPAKKKSILMAGGK